MNGKFDEGLKYSHKATDDDETKGRFRYSAPKLFKAMNIQCPAFFACQCMGSSVMEALRSLPSWNASICQFTVTRMCLPCAIKFKITQSERLRLITCEALGSGNDIFWGDLHMSHIGLRFLARWQTGFWLLCSLHLYCYIVSHNFFMVASSNRLWAYTGENFISPLAS